MNTWDKKTKFDLESLYDQIYGTVPVNENAPPTEITGGEPVLAAKGSGIFSAPASTSGSSKDKPVGDYYLKGAADKGSLGQAVAVAVLKFLREQPNNTYPGTRQEMQARITDIIKTTGLGGKNAEWSARILQRVMLDNGIIKDEMGMSSKSGHRAIRVAPTPNASALLAGAAEVLNQIAAGGGPPATSTSEAPPVEELPSEPESSPEPEPEPEPVKPAPPKRRKR